jgi:outer membrane lipoprotein carrier protein
MTFLDRLGQATELEFFRLERNPRFDASLFRFEPPPGADVVGRSPAT